MREGVIVAGNMVLDRIHRIDRYPAPGMLANVLHFELSTGGALCNVLLGLSRLMPELPLRAVGVLGRDAMGEEVLRHIRQAKDADLSSIRRAGETSFTNVMQENDSGRRTFFHSRGSNALLCPEDFHWDALGDARILHIGYVFLLDTLDSPDHQYGTKMARVLHDAQAHGILTCLDAVSEKSERTRSVALPALVYTDYLIINEIEAGAIAEIEPRGADGTLDRNAIRRILTMLRAAGVKRWIVVHAPEGGFGLDETGEYQEVSSACLPDGFIAGTVGAGDAFCSGVIASIYRDKPLAEALEAGCASACCSMRNADSISGMVTMEESLRVFRGLKRI